jgi:type I restriction enzyme R subunit
LGCQPGKSGESFRHRGNSLWLERPKTDVQGATHSEKIALADEDAEIGPVPMSGGVRKAELELDRLSNILKNFNDQFSTLFTDADRVVRRIREDIAPKVAADQAYQNAKKNTPNAAGIELEAALKRVVTPLYKDDTEFFKQFVQNESFKRFVTDMVLTLTSEEIDSSKPTELASR